MTFIAIYQNYLSEHGGGGFGSNVLYLYILFLCMPMSEAYNNFIFYS